MPVQINMKKCPGCNSYYADYILKDEKCEACKNPPKAALPVKKKRRRKKK